MGSQVSEATQVMVALRRIVRVLRLSDREAEATVGLSAAQLFVLHALRQAPDCSLGELAERTLTDQSSVSTVVAKLVARKLVARKHDPRDRRRAVLALTAAGEKVARTAPRMPQARVLDAVAAMSAEKRAALVRALDSLVVAFGANDVAPSMLFEDEPAPVRRRTRSPRRVRG